MIRNRDERVWSIESLADLAIAKRVGMIMVCESRPVGSNWRAWKACCSRKEAKDYLRYKCRGRSIEIVEKSLLNNTIDVLYPRRRKRTENGR